MLFFICWEWQRTSLTEYLLSKMFFNGKFSGNSICFTDRPFVKIFTTICIDFPLLFSALKSERWTNRRVKKIRVLINFGVIATANQPTVNLLFSPRNCLTKTQKKTHTVSNLNRINFSARFSLFWFTDSRKSLGFIVLINLKASCLHFHAQRHCDALGIICK